LAAGFGRLRLCLKFIWKQSDLRSETENLVKRSKSMRALSFILCAVVLSNCAAVVAVPPIIQYVSTAASLVSYVATGKGTSDHVISAITEQDCALHRALFEEEICFEETQTIAMTDAAARGAE